MKKMFFFALCCAWALVWCPVSQADETSEAESLELRMLPPPSRSGGMPLMEAMNKRQTTRTYKKLPITEQQMSDVLWSACGISRKDGRRTIGTAQNWQDVLVYVLDEKAAWLYLPKENAMQLMVSGDHRNLVGSQFFVRDAAVTLLYVSDTTKLENTREPTTTTLAAFHAGEMAQNVALYCASVGLGDVIRVHFAELPLKDLLDLPATHRVVMTHTLGVTD